jgi:RNA polymerase-binding transcription factor DksA
VARKTTGKQSSNAHKSRVAGKHRDVRKSASASKKKASSDPRGSQSKPSRVVEKRSLKPLKTGEASKSKTTPKPVLANQKPAPKTPAVPAAVQAESKPVKPKTSPNPFGRGKKIRTVAEAASGVSADSKGYVFINGRRVRMISIKLPVTARKPRNNGIAEAAPVADATPIKSIKTKLSRKELNHYRDLLILKRRELVGDLRAMENEALRSGGGNLSHMPIHMADIGTDTYDQDFMLGLAANERDQLREIDAALQRIEDRTYGVCQLTGKPIPKARLDAKPWAKYTIEAARKMEGQWGR